MQKNGYTLRVLKTDADVVIGEVNDYMGSPDGQKTELYITTNEGEKVFIDPYDNALQQNLTYLKLESPSEMLGETFRFSKREFKGKWLFDVKRASPDDETPAAAPPRPASVSSSAPTPAAAMTITDASTKYDEAVAAVLKTTVPRLEAKLMGDLTETVLAEFVHAAAATILIASTPRQSSFPPKAGGGGGGGRPGWKK